MNTANFDREWYDAIETDPADSVKLDFAIAVERAIRQKGVSRSDLARLISSSPAWITKVMRGDANLTIDTMCLLADALEHEVHIHLAPKTAAVKWLEVYENASTAVHQRESKAISGWRDQLEALRDKQIPNAA